MKIDEARAILEDLRQQVPESEGRVRLRVEDDIGWIELDHPAVRNAMSVRMMCDLADAVASLQGFDGRAAILCSAEEGMFCAGGNLDEVQQALGEPEQGLQMARAMGAVLDALHDLPLIVVGAAEGVAVGGGAELLTACDLRVLKTGARVHFVQARLGVAPGWGGAGRLVRQLGRGPALHILAHALPITAQEALDLGFADAVVDRPAVEGALALLEPLRKLPAAALRAVKKQVVSAGDPEAQAEHFAEVWGGPDHRAALEALLARQDGR